MSPKMQEVVARYLHPTRNNAKKLIVWALVTAKSVQEAAEILKIPLTTFRRWARSLGINIQKVVQESRTPLRVIKRRRKRK